MGKPSATVKVRGADQVQRSLRKLSKDIKHMDEVAGQGADMVAASARSYARVLTGRMRGSIQINQTGEGAQVVAGEGIASPYPAVQEYGSRRLGISPNRYMGRAMEATEPAVVRLFEDEVTNAADKVKGA